MGEIADRPEIGSIADWLHYMAQTPKADSPLPAQVQTLSHVADWVESGHSCSPPADDLGRGVETEKRAVSLAHPELLVIPCLLSQFALSVPITTS